MKPNHMLEIARNMSGLLRHTERINRKQRPNLHSEAGSITAAQLFHMLHFTPGPTLFCGSQSKAIPVLKQLAARIEKPSLMLGTAADFRDSPLSALPVEWEDTALCASPAPGSGRITLSPSPQTILQLKQYLPQWEEHAPILCLGRGLQLDGELLNLLNALGSYVLLTDSPARSMKSSDTYKLNTEVLLSCMDYLFVSAAGSSLAAFVNILPKYERASFSSTLDATLNRDEHYMEYSDGPRDNGLGGRISGTYGLSEKSLLTQDELIREQDANRMVCMDLRRSHVWLCRIIR